jgi:hypothetical protein
LKSACDEWKCTLKYPNDLNVITNVVKINPTMKGWHLKGENLHAKNKLRTVCNLYDRIGLTTLSNVMFDKYLIPNGIKPYLKKCDNQETAVYLR